MDGYAPGNEMITVQENISLLLVKFKHNIFIMKQLLCMCLSITPLGHFGC